MGKRIPSTSHFYLNDKKLRPEPIEGNSPAHMFDNADIGISLNEITVEIRPTYDIETS